VLDGFTQCARRRSQLAYSLHSLLAALRDCGSLSSCYNPTAAVAFWRNSSPVQL